MIELTQREREIIGTIVAGYTTSKQIGYMLQIRPGTIRHHMANIFDKTNVRDKAALVLWALRNGWQLEQQV